jgi:tetratricopeptide (TPR) repeat protein
MFNLGFQYSEVVTPGLKIKAESKAVKEIKGVDGILFPLKVGNALFFTYTYLNSQDKFGVTFEVKEKVLAQKFVKDHPEIKDLNLIGDIYLISKESQSTNDNIHIDPCELYFSDELSYVIGGSCADKDQWMKSYKLTKAGIAYREEVTALNKAREQEALDKKIRTSAQLTPEMKAKGKAKFTQAFQLFQTNEFEAAVIRFNQGLEIDPANGVGHYYLAETYSRLNDNENAMEHYRYTFVFEPDIKEAPIAQVKYEKLKATLGK